MKNIINILLAIALIVSLTACGGSSGGSDNNSVPEPVFKVVDHRIEFVLASSFVHYTDMGYSDFDAFMASEPETYTGDTVSWMKINMLVVHILNERRNDLHITIVITKDQYGDRLHATYNYDLDEVNRDNVYPCKILWPGREDIGETLEVEVWATDAQGNTTSSYVFDITVTE
jgi:hypothetical protein